MVSGSTELDALGDEMMFDEDSSYLDDASTAPSIPEGLPGDKSTSRVRSHGSSPISLDTAHTGPSTSYLPLGPHLFHL